MAKAEIEIIHQDSNILVINKPSGLSVTKNRSGGGELISVLQKQLGTDKDFKLRIVHRLDKDASGVMILAKNSATQSQICSAFEKRLVKKTYLALVNGSVTRPRGTINASLARSRKKAQFMCISRKGAKEAVTKWQLLADFGTVSLLAVFPLTGRTHQIRVHLASISLPLVIDPLYGSSRGLLLSDFKTPYRLGKRQREKPLIERLTLHAYELDLTNVKLNCPARFVAGLDKKFTAMIKMLTRHNPNGPDAFINPDVFFRIMNNRELD